MRPLPANLKTALIFYSVFAGLLLLVNRWSPVGLSSATPGTGFFLPTADGVVDLTSIQTNFEAAWQRHLEKAGYQNTIITDNKTRLIEEKLGPNTVKWVKANTILELPVAVTEEPLVSLGIAWKDLARQLGFSNVTVKWGSSDQLLWLKLSGEYQVAVAGTKITLPLQEITIKQLLTSRPFRQLDWGRLLPAPAPFLPEKPPVKTTQVKELVVKPPEPLQPPQPKLPKFIKRARVAIIIDDVGYQREPADRLLRIPAHLTWSVLPFTPYGKEYARLGQKRGFEVMLHQPLEPLPRPNTPDPGPGLIKRNWTEAEIQEQLEANLRDIPEAVGINNHMGSAGTTDARLMDLLMQDIEKHHLFFVDSHTVAGSLAAKYARKYQLPTATNRVFIDDSNDVEAKKAKLRELLKIALRDGEAVAIGHVRSGTPEAIEAVLPEFAAAGVEIVPVSELVK